MQPFTITLQWLAKKESGQALGKGGITCMQEGGLGRHGLNQTGRRI